MRKTKTYLALTRVMWMLLTVFLVICTGPVKKLIELRVDNIAAESSSPVSQNNDKKLKTWYREKREIAPLISSAYEHTNEGLILFFVTSFISLFLLTAKSNSGYPVYKPVIVVGAMPRYLHCRKLLV